MLLTSDRGDSLVSCVPKDLVMVKHCEKSHLRCDFGTFSRRRRDFFLSMHTRICKNTYFVSETFEITTLSLRPLVPFLVDVPFFADGRMDFPRPP